MLSLSIMKRRRLRSILAYLFAAFLLALAVPFLLSLTKQASHARNWKDDVARLPVMQLDGDTLTIQNVRNTRYPAVPTDLWNDYTVAWDTRDYDLSKAQRLWFMVESFSDIDAIAHTFLSFEFAGGEFLSFSIEARGEKGESFGLVKGLLREFELAYIFGDERDFVWRRAVYQDHEVYMYPLITPPSEVQALLKRLTKAAAELQAKPRFYNSITDNCTSTLVRFANRVRPGSFPPFVVQQTMPGLSDTLLYRKGWLAVDVPLEDLRATYAVKEVAQTYADDPDFSRRVREALPPPTTPVTSAK